MDTVRVTEIRAIQKQGPLRAFADVRIGDLVIADFGIFQQNNGRFRVEVPMRTWKDPVTNELRFRAIVTLSDDLMRRVQAEILSCYYRIMEEKESDQKEQ